MSRHQGVLVVCSSMTNISFASVVASYPEVWVLFMYSQNLWRQTTIYTQWSVPSRKQVDQWFMVPPLISLGRKFCGCIRKMNQLPLKHEVLCFTYTRSPGTKKCWNASCKYPIWMLRFLIPISCNSCLRWYIIATSSFRRALDNVAALGTLMEDQSSNINCIMLSRAALRYAPSRKLIDLADLEVVKHKVPSI